MTIDPATEELIVLVNEDNEPIGTAPKLASHHADTPLHRAFSAFLFNDRGELLLQQRALHKKTWPGVWSNSVCGHLLPDETVEHAAIRRLEYELGLRDVALHMILPKYRYRFEKDGIVENEICPVLVGFTNDTGNLNPLEVNAVQWIPWQQFLADTLSPDTIYSPWAVEEAQLLQKSDEFRKLLEAHAR